MTSDDRETVFTAIPKHLHFAKDHIAQFVLNEGFAPITPYGIPFWMLDTVPREAVREANKAYLYQSDRLWVFGTKDNIGTDHQINGVNISDGVAEEIEIAKAKNTPIQVFTIDMETQEIERLE